MKLVPVTMGGDRKATGIGGAEAGGVKACSTAGEAGGLFAAALRFGELTALDKRCARFCFFGRGD